MIPEALLHHLLALGCCTSNNVKDACEALGKQRHVASCGSQRKHILQLQNLVLRSALDPPRQELRQARDALLDQPDLAHQLAEPHDSLLVVALSGRLASLPHDLPQLLQRSLQTLQRCFLRLGVLGLDMQVPLDRSCRNLPVLIHHGSRHIVHTRLQAHDINGPLQRLARVGLCSVKDAHALDDLLDDLAGVFQSAREVVCL
mmetsp:Transcript_4821/g.11450  ORF Transcript_4821/g.11450 Transcript_4821/m.11450 type:complete len:202 (-) Transcript_4821:260-865(-)